MERIELWIYNFIIQGNVNYHCLLFNDCLWILPFEQREIDLLNNENEQAYLDCWIKLFYIRKKKENYENNITRLWRIHYKSMIKILRKYYNSITRTTITKMLWKAMSNYENIPRIDYEFTTKIIRKEIL